MFLTHGIGATKDAWRFIAPKLSENFTVITYDLRGHGKSPVIHKNFDLQVKGNFNEDCNGHRTIKISGHFKETVDGMHNKTIMSVSRETYKGNRTIIISGDLNGINELQFILNSSPTMTQQIILPRFEIDRLVK